MEYGSSLVSVVILFWTINLTCKPESFNEIEKHYPELVNIDSKGRDKHPHLQTDLFEREAKESREMTKASEVVEGFWVSPDAHISKLISWQTKWKGR